MPKTKIQKQAILENLSNKISKMKSAAMFNFSGIEVKELNQLRDVCREAGVDYLVAKKTLLKKALTDQGLGDIAGQDFNGEVATIFSYDDEIAPARIVADFGKKNNKVKFVGGIFEGGYADVNKLTELSKIPSRHELLSKVVGCLSNPLSGLARVINAIKEDKEKQTI